MSNSMPRDLPGRTLHITQLEGMYLSDTVEVPDGMAGDTEWARFFLKVGAAIIEPMGADITFTRNDLWEMRQYIKSGATVGTEPVGRNLILKVYAALIEIANEEGASEIDHLTRMFEEGDTDGTMPS